MIPAPYREIIRSNYGNKLFITNAAFDKCLHIYPDKEWNHLEEKVRELPKMDETVKYFMRRVIASAHECEMDKQGRILIPSALREDSGININDDIVIVGQVDKIELWNRKEWDTVMDPEKIDKRMYQEKLSEFGL